MARLLLALLLANLLVFRTAPAVAQDDGYDDGGYQDDAGSGYADDSAPAPDDYEEALAGEGEWVDDPEYGRVWHPAVASDWRPYVDGYWAWGPEGWTWVSYEPWGWTFHYGRWGFTPSFGWVWVPGTVWGPAWVDWFWGDGFVGWAPLAPFGNVTIINQFIFVHAHDFCSPHLTTVVVDHHLVPDRVIHDWHHRDFRPPDHHRIEQISNHPIRRFDHRPQQTLAPRRGDGGQHVARPNPDGRSMQLGRAFERPRAPFDPGRDRVERRPEAPRAWARPAPPRSWAESPRGGWARPAAPGFTQPPRPQVQNIQRGAQPGFAPRGFGAPGLGRPALARSGFDHPGFASQRPSFGPGRLGFQQRGRQQ